MTNEEKILELLEGLTRSVSGIDSRLERLETGQAALEGRVTRMEGEVGFWRLGFDRMERMQTALEGRMGRLETDVSGVKVLLDTDVQKQLQTLAEGDEALAERLDRAVGALDKVEHMAEDTKDMMDVVYAAVKQHSGEIAELKKAR